MGTRRPGAALNVMRPERISEPAAEWVHLDSLRPWVKNPRRNDHAAREVAQSIRRFGFGAPLVARRENLEIIAGHTRVKAALLLAREWAEASAEERESWHPDAVQVATEKMLPVRLRDLSEHEAHLLAIADNKLGELADWDEPGLADVLGAYGPEDALLAGFTEEELEAIGSVGNDALDAVGHVANDTPPDPPEEPVTKPGDIWILGRHRVVCGDAKDPRCIAAALGDGEAHLLLTDPPYNVGYVGATKDKLTIQNDSMEDGAFRQFLVDTLGPSFAALSPGSSFYIWHADVEGYNFRGAVRDLGQRVRQCLIWVKNSLVLGRQDYQWQHEPCLYGWTEGAPHRWFSDRKQTTTLHFDKPPRNAQHPTMKPPPLFAYQMGNSTKRGERTLDPFLGSGTSVVAAEQMDRACSGTELDPRYCDVIVERWENLTGEKASRARL